jgi:hypothetical protein
MSGSPAGATLFSTGPTASGGAIVLENCDNNSFYRTMVDGGTNGFGVIVVDPHVAQSNYFYHLQPGKGLRVNNSGTLLQGNEGKNSCSLARRLRSPAIRSS